MVGEPGHFGKMHRASLEYLTTKYGACSGCIIQQRQSFHASAAPRASGINIDPATMAYVRGGLISSGRSRADLDSKT